MNTFDTGLIGEMKPTAYSSAEKISVLYDKDTGDIDSVYIGDMPEYHKDKDWVETTDKLIIEKYDHGHELYVDVKLKTPKIKAKDAQNIEEARLANLITESVAKVDEIVSTFRKDYVSMVTYQGNVYQAKYADAQKYIDDGYPEDITPYKWVQADAAAFGVTAEVAANTIVAKGDEWNTVAMETETLRLEYKNHLKNMGTYDNYDDYRSAVGTIITNLAESLQGIRDTYPL